MQKWLRKNYKVELHIEVNYSKEGKHLGYIFMLDKFSENNIHDNKSYDEDQLNAIAEKSIYNTYEETLDAGLLRALLLIKIENWKPYV